MFNEKWSYEINPKILDELKSLNKGVIIAGPHTSILDGYHSAKFITRSHIREVFTKGSIKIGMKKEMFPPLIGNTLKRIGFVPIDRKNPKGYWDEIEKSKEADEKAFWALSPEGTRKPVENWKSGFLRIAETLNAPIIVAYIDYKERRVRIEEIISTDMFLSEGKIDKTKIPVLEEIFQGIFKKVIPKNPEKFNPEIKIKYRSKN